MDFTTRLAKTDEIIASMPKEEKQKFLEEYMKNTDNSPMEQKVLNREIFNLVKKNMNICPTNSYDNDLKDVIKKAGVLKPCTGIKLEEKLQKMTIEKLEKHAKSPMGTLIKNMCVEKTPEEIAQENERYNKAREEYKERKAQYEQQRQNNQEKIRELEEEYKEAERKYNEYPKDTYNKNEYYFEMERLKVEIDSLNNPELGICTNSFNSDANFRQMTKIINKTYDKWDNNLIQEEKDAMKFYSHSGDGILNTSHRYGLEKHLHKISAKHKKHLDKTISDYELSEPITVMRGVDENFFKALNLPLDESIVGKIYHEKGYMSTSIRGKVANGFSKPKKGDRYEKYLISFEVPAGKGNGAFIKEYSKYKPEEEFLLKRDTEIEFTDYAVYNNKLYLKARWVK